MRGSGWVTGAPAGRPVNWSQTARGQGHDAPGAKRPASARVLLNDSLLQTGIYFIKSKFSVNMVLRLNRFD